MTLQSKIFVSGGTGTTGRRIVQRLQARNVPVRIGSRAANPAFDWEQEFTWTAALQDMDAAYIAFQPDLAVPGAVETIQKFVDVAVKTGVKRLVLLSGRGEPEAQACEQIVQNSGVGWTILRASWFAQNFSERFLRDSLLSGEVYLPVGDVQEPFIDAEDIADVAVAALTEDGHTGQLYELTGPRLLTFAETIAEIAQATGRQIHYIPVSMQDYVAALEAAQVPADAIWLVNYLFTTVLDGRNACLTNGVQRALNRQPRDFADYVRETAATGVWDA